MKTKTKILKLFFVISLMWLLGALPAYAQEANEIATSTIPTEETEFNVSFLYPPSVLANDSVIYARTNMQADEMKFIANDIEYPAILSTQSVSYYYNYSFQWVIGDLENGDYVLKVIAKKDDKSVSATTTIKINRQKTAETATSTLENIVATSSLSSVQAEAKATSTLGVQIIAPESPASASNSALIIIKTYGVIKNVELEAIGPEKTEIIASSEPNSINFEWVYLWNTSSSSDGKYLLQANAYDKENKKLISNILVINLKKESIATATFETFTLEANQATSSAVLKKEAKTEKVDEVERLSSSTAEAIEKVISTLSSETEQVQEQKNEIVTKKTDLKIIEITIVLIIMVLIALLYFRMRQERNSKIKKSPQ